MKHYLNPAQYYTLLIGANSETIIASRRFGKSDGIIAPRILRNVQHMPRSAGAFYAATFQQALTRTLPGTIAALERMGYKNDVHFFVGRQAGKNSSFQNPYINPRKYDHVMHWYNGSIINILSQDVQMSTNSLTLDYLMVDEGRSIKPEKMYQEVIPAISGMINKFDNCPWHKGITIVSDMPILKREQWVLDRDKEQTPDIISDIEATLQILYSLRKSGKKSDQKYFKQLLLALRRKAFLYREYDVFENIEILGEDYVKKMKKELTPLIFQTSILNRRIKKITGGFYPNINENIHYYTVSNASYFDNIRTNHDTFDISRLASQQTCLKDTDLINDLPLIITIDYGANINWIVTGQCNNNKLYTLSSMFVKYEQKLRSLLEKWHTYYSARTNRDVVFYYNSTALEKGFADEQSESFADIVIETLTNKGWNVNNIYMGQPFKHMLKHQYIDDAMCGRKYTLPLFNKDNNEFLLPAMENTGVKLKGDGSFTKDKSNEKYAESNTDPLELRTDGTDAWDDLFIGVNFFPFTSNGYAYGSSFIG